MKKTLSIILAFFITFSSVLCANAAEIDNAVYSDVSDAMAGRTICVPIKIRNNTGFMGFSLRFEYDKDVLNPIAVSADEALSSGMLNDSIEYSLSKGRNYFNVIWTGNGNFTTDTTLFYITFSVIRKLSDKTTISVSYNQVDTFDVNYRDVKLNCEPIDINFSGTVEPKMFAEPVTAKAGEIISIPIKATDYSSVTSFSLTALIPNEYFTFIRAEGGVTATLSGNIVTIVRSDNATSDDGTMFSLVLQVDANAYGNAEIALSVTESSCNASADNIQVAILSQDVMPTVFSDDVVSPIDRRLIVPVQLKNNRGIMGLRIDIGYDSEILTLVNVTKGTVLNKGSFDTNLGYTQPGSCLIVWNSTEDTENNGLLFTLEFEVSATAKGGNTQISLSYSQPDTYNEEWEDVELCVENIRVRINQLSIICPDSSLRKGETALLSTKYSEHDSLPQIVEWKSDNTLIATINTAGIVTAKKYGKTVITAIDEFGNVASYSLVVSPINPIVTIVNKSGSNMQKINWWKKYSSAKMFLAYSCYGCEGAVSYKWFSDNPRVKIDENGVITNNGPFARSANISLIFYDANGSVFAESSIKVSFYKFKWQRSRLQAQTVTKNAYESNDTKQMQNYMATNDNESVDFESIISIFCFVLEKVFDGLLLNID